MFDIQIPQLLINYAQLSPFLLASLISAIMFVPWAGKLSFKLGAIDVPDRLRSRTESAERNTHRINEKITPRLGGLALVLGMGVGLIALSGNADFTADPIWPKLWGVVLGVAILTVIGVLDDMLNLPAKYQLVAQVMAALAVVGSGITIQILTFASVTADLVNQTITLGGNTFGGWWVPSAAVFTVLWIVALINFINWVGGVDGLNGSFSSIAGIAMLLIAMQRGELAVAGLIAVYLGGVLGVLPFNYHPSRIFYGFGEGINGFMLAVFSILASGKFAVSIIILGLPLLDALWVSVIRIRQKSKQTWSPLKLLAATMKPDRNHLHHRLLDLGYGWKTVLYIEIAIVATFAAIAFYFNGFTFEDTTLQLTIVFAGLLVIFAMVGAARGRVRKLREQAQLEASKKPRVDVKVLRPENEAESDEKYVY